ncbi:MAG: hypothetical protein EBS55_09130 [Flavobacteriaceae bacterium]|nr:hypothetical protein [Flavobacteriaceae bacterium]
MNNEDLFVRELSAFLDTKFNDFSKTRIIRMLSDYKSRLPPVTITKFIERTVVEKRQPSAPMKSLITESEMFIEAKQICDLYEIDMNMFMTKKKCLAKVASARKAFCRKMYNQYMCNNSMLSKFFDVHHTTISFYLHGKSN